MEPWHVEFNNSGWNKNHPWQVVVHPQLTKHFRSKNEAREYINKLKEWLLS